MRKVLLVLSLVLVSASASVSLMEQGNITCQKQIIEKENLFYKIKNESDTKKKLLLVKGTSSAITNVLNCLSSFKQDNKEAFEKNEIENKIAEKKYQEQVWEEQNKKTRGCSNFLNIAEKRKKERNGLSYTYDLSENYALTNEALIKYNTCINTSIVEEQDRMKEQQDRIEAKLDKLLAK